MTSEDVTLLLIPIASPPDHQAIVRTPKQGQKWLCPFVSALPQTLLPEVLIF
jgi:hypothetical protein